MKKRTKKQMEKLKIPNSAKSKQGRERLKYSRGYAILTAV